MRATDLSSKESIIRRYTLLWSAAAGIAMGCVVIGAGPVSAAGSYRVQAVVPARDLPDGAAQISSTHRLYVANYFSNTVSVVSE